MKIITCSSISSTRLWYLLEYQSFYSLVLLILPSSYESISTDKVSGKDTVSFIHHYMPNI